MLLQNPLNPSGGICEYARLFCVEVGPFPPFQRSAQNEVPTYYIIFLALSNAKASFIILVKTQYFGLFKPNQNFIFLSTHHLSTGMYGG